MLQRIITVIVTTTPFIIIALITLTMLITN
jgi:hypothetical protein